jgi:hypothetical protein
MRRTLLNGEIGYMAARTNKVIEDLTWIIQYVEFYLIQSPF